MTSHSTTPQAGTPPSLSGSSLDTTAESEPVWSVGPAPTTLQGRLFELWEYRGFARWMAAAALRRRYRRTRLGWLWLVVRPLFAAVAGTILFSGFLSVDAGGVPYVLFYGVGLAIWSLFDAGLLWGTRSLEINRRLLRTRYFPRVWLPLSHLFPAIVEFCVFLVVIVGLMGYYGTTGDVAPISVGSLLIALLAVIYALTLVLAISLWTAVLGAHNRDLRFSLRYLLQFWLFITPVIYPLDYVPQVWRAVVTYNPATPAVLLFRQGLLSLDPVPPAALWSGIVTTVVLLVGGLWFFHHAAITSSADV